MEVANPRKRRMELRDDESNSECGRVCRFKILLPNGTSVELSLRDPEPEMSLWSFLNLVKSKYSEARRHCKSMTKIRDINWKGGSLFLQDANDKKIRNVLNLKNYKPNKCHILRLHDGSSEVAQSFENMWDLTPDTDLLLELPEEYTFETALADLIDNSLQAVWSNGEDTRKLIRVNLGKSKLSIFDNGPGMDDTDENSIVKWGKMGASLHRYSKSKAIGGKPPYLMPYFGMFGYGGPIASMHLGRRALVSSKTKHVKKVYVLNLEREALLNASSSEVAWKTGGRIRDPSANEIRDSHGSFTKVDIYDPKIKDVNINRLKCHLKDIYFPYIQNDDTSDIGKTITPIEFQVNDVDLTEIQGGEVAITNLHSCNGPEFVFQLHLSLAVTGKDGIKSASSRESQANARLRFVYLPFTKGKENIERILEKLQEDGFEVSENFQSFSRVSIRRLGRLLPDARWTLLPFMESKYKKGIAAHILKRCSLRVKCFIETDGGFKPTISKTDLAHHNSFTIALKNLGYKLSEKEKYKSADVTVEIRKATKVLNLVQLQREYHKWILQMHAQYDEEADSGEDQPVIIVRPTNKMALGISSDVIRVHQVLNRKEKSWKRGQKVKVLKGACAGFHRTTIYATLEYFLLEGFEGDAGGEARIICRAIDIPDENGCFLSVEEEDASLDIRSSFSLPISVIDSGKLVAVESFEWENRLKKKQQNSPINLPGGKHYEHLEANGVVAAGSIELENRLKKKQQKSPSIKLPVANLHEHLEAEGGVVAVGSIERENRLNKKQQKSPSINLSGANHYEHLEADGLDQNYRRFDEEVIVKSSHPVGEYRLLPGGQSLPLDVRVGSAFSILDIAYYDMYNNQAPFQSIPDVTVKLQTDVAVHYEVHGIKVYLSTDRMTLKIKDVIISSNELDKIRPSYRATLNIYSRNVPLSLSIHCRVYPGFPYSVKLKPKIIEDQLIPGFIFKELMLEMFDIYENHLFKGLEVTLAVAGFNILDDLGMIRKVDDKGIIDLSGLLKLTAGYGENAFISVILENQPIFKREFSTVRRKLKIASGVPDFCAAAGHLENIDFEIVNPDQDIVDMKFHHNDKDGQYHMLTIKSDFFNAEESFRYTFKHGRCRVPSIRIPIEDGTFCFEAAHSQFKELCLTVEVPVVKMPIMNYVGQPPSTDKNIIALQEPSLYHENTFMQYFVNHDKELIDSIQNLGVKIERVECLLNNLKEQKAKTEQDMVKLLEKVPSFPLDIIDSSFTKEELMAKIKSMENSPYSVLCNLSKGEKSQKYFSDDLIGVVVLTGTVQRPELSRILAEYLGKDKMLGLIYRSFDAASSLEKYNQKGEIDYERALHAEAASVGKAISKRFHVICFEDIRPYTGLLHGNDSQRRLALPDPSMPNGVTPEGFIGYAVNMVDLDIEYLQITTASGHGLRETVLFNLFKKLQVYDTRHNMMAARTCIEDGAVSLDGGILSENGILSLGYGNPSICFPCENQKEVEEILAQIKDKKSELWMLEEGIRKLTKRRAKYIKKFNEEKEKYDRFTDAMKPKTEELLEYIPETWDASNTSGRLS